MSRPRKSRFEEADDEDEKDVVLGGLSVFQICSSEMEAAIDFALFADLATNRLIGKCIEK